MGENKDKIRIKYYECNMSKIEHILAYIVFAVAIAVILYIYYHILIISVIGGLIIAVWQEKNYAKSVRKRKVASNNIPKIALVSNASLPSQFALRKIFPKYWNC